MAIIGRGIREFGYILPGQMGHVLARSMLLAGIPFAAAAVSAYVLDALAQRRDRGAAMMAGILGPILLFLLSIWRNHEDCRIAVGYGRLFSSHEIGLTNKAYSLPYGLLEADSIRQLRNEVSGSMNLSGGGMASLYWDMDVFWTSLASAAAAAAVAACLLGRMAAGETAEGAAGGTGTVVFGLALLVAVSCALSCRMTGRRFDATFQVFLKGAQHSRYGDFYHMEYLRDEEAAMDARIYRQEELILSQCQSKCYEYLAESKEKEFRAVNRYDGVKLAASCICGCAVYLVIGQESIRGRIGIGSMLLLYSAVTWLIEALARMTEIVTDLRNNNEHLLRYFRYMDLPEQGDGRAEEPEGAEGCGEDPEEDSHIRIAGVSFRYPGSDSLVLKNVDFSIRAGERVAIVGENGSGKTTLIKLLCRLYRPEEGKILLNGKDIQAYPYNQYMGYISTVFQDYSLFAFPIAENVAGSRDYDQDRVLAALGKAGLAERVGRCARGIRQPLFHDFDQEGIDLSGGEGQKLAIARAAYKDAGFMILDEPTAALDPYAEYEIYENFGRIAEGRTVLFVSHRLSSCRMCDRIVVMHRGEAVQCGTHEELLADENGKYRQLWDAQAQYYA